MTWTSINAIPNYIISRQTISKKSKNINYNYFDIPNKKETPKVLYIEADEVHGNPQYRNNGTKNKIVPVILTYEGPKESFVRKKKLKNTHYIASSILKANKFLEETYKYLDSVYYLNKVDKLFLSNDGGSWITGYDIASPNVIFFLDKFHYKKALNYIFKKESIITNIADNYLRNTMVHEFKLLVKIQYQLYPDQKKKMIEKQNYLINHIDRIINQNHHDYKCSCSMEGHISNKYAKFITSRPHSDELENITQLLTIKANNTKLTEKIYIKFKTGKSVYKKINLKKFITLFKN